MYIKDGVKFTLALLVATLTMLAIRAYAFTIFTVPDDGLRPLFDKGDRLIVNRLSREHFMPGDVVVYGENDKLAGEIVALPGDTVVIGTTRYLVPTQCCRRCRCKDCQTYIIKVGTQRQTIRQHDIVGRAHKLFHLPW